MRITPFTAICLAGLVAAVPVAAAPAAGHGDQPTKPMKTKPVRGTKHFTGTKFDDTWSGTAKGDHARGLAGNDALAGLGGGDRIWGGLGADTVSGGDGNDFLWPGPGADKVDAGAGNDRIFAADNDRTIDTITCGGGKDRVILRSNDVAGKDCEIIVLVGNKPISPTPPPTTETTPPRQ